MFSVEDQKWIDALKPYWGGRQVPFWRNTDGTVDAAQTIDYMMRTRGEKKVGANGEPLEWPAEEG